MTMKTAHIENLVTCVCGEKYCIVCKNECPKCNSVHLKPSRGRIWLYHFGMGNHIFDFGNKWSDIT